MRGIHVTDRTLILGVLAAYAAGAAIVLSILVSTILWPGVANGF
jgi:hypothetical protein